MLIDFEVDRRARFADGREFGTVGPYVVEHGRATYALDPTEVASRRILDLDLAPTDARGRVVFTGDVRLVRPFISENANGVGIIDVVNRGRPFVERFVNRANAPASPVPADPDPGDGFAFEQGWTVLSVGWQHDLVHHDSLCRLEAPQARTDDGGPFASQVSIELQPPMARRHLRLAAPDHVAPPPAEPDDPYAVLVTAIHQHGPWRTVPRHRWSFGREQNGHVRPSNRHIHLVDGFEANHFYSVSYRTAATPVVGAGLLAVRDAARWLHAVPGLDTVIGLGVSQTGRLLRHFSALGLNQPGAFDGLYIHIGGARRGEFNNRQGSPGTLFRPSLASLPPFDQGLFDTQRSLGGMPKVMVSNTSTEYWRSDASLCHTDLYGTEDSAAAPDVRHYHHAGTQHVASGLPQIDTDPLLGGRARHGFNVVDNRLLLRAEMMALIDWIVGGIDPPPDRHPRLDEGTLIERSEAMAQLEPMGLEPLDLERLPVIGPYDLGPGYEAGIVEHPVTPSEGTRYRTLVPALDETGNEIGGVALPDVARPVGVHTGWNVRADGTTLYPTRGTTVFFSADDLAARYGDRASYLKEAARVTDRLVAERRLLTADRQEALDAVAAQWDAALVEPTE